MNRPKLLDQVREATRLRHLSLRTEQAYFGWIRRYVLFHDKRHPCDWVCSAFVPCSLKR